MYKNRRSSSGWTNDAPFRDSHSAGPWLWTDVSAAAAGWTVCWHQYAATRKTEPRPRDRAAHPAGSHPASGVVYAARECCRVCIRHHRNPDRRSDILAAGRAGRQPASHGGKPDATLNGRAPAAGGTRTPAEPHRGRCGRCARGTGLGSSRRCRHGDGKECGVAGRLGRHAESAACRRRYSA